MRELERPVIRKDKPHAWDTGSCARGARCEAWGLSSVGDHGWPVCSACGRCWWDAPERCAKYSETPIPSPGLSVATGAARETPAPVALPAEAVA